MATTTRAAPSQLAYYYAAYLPIDEDESRARRREGGRAADRPLVARRGTQAGRGGCGVDLSSKSPGARHLYESANGAECVALLTQKVLCAAVDEGFREARLLLQDWLVVVLGKYHRMYGAHADRIGDPDALCRSLRQIRAGCSRCSGAAALVEHAACRTRCARRARRSSRRISRCRRAASTAIYPALYCYHSADKVASSEPPPLSWAALRAARGALFLLDAPPCIYAYLRADDDSGGGGGGGGGGGDGPPAWWPPRRQAP